VRDGKQVTAFLSNGMTVTGWVFGADDYHWSIANDEGQIFLIHKTTPAVQIHPEPTIDNAPEHIQQMVTPYRDAVLRDHFKSTSSRQK
jgi:sRNA-binding regulator protein Hfq